MATSLWGTRTWAFSQLFQGTTKCLVALAGPFSAAYLPIFNCPVFSGIVGIGAMSHTTLRANPLLSQQKFASHARSPVLSPSLRECHTWAQALPSAVTLAGPNWLQRTHTIMESCVAIQCYHASNTAVALQEEGYRKMCCARCPNTSLLGRLPQPQESPKSTTAYLHFLLIVRLLPIVEFVFDCQGSDVLVDMVAWNCYSHGQFENGHFNEECLSL